MVLYFARKGGLVAPDPHRCAWPAARSATHDRRDRAISLEQRDVGVDVPSWRGTHAAVFRGVAFVTDAPRRQAWNGPLRENERRTSSSATGSQLTASWLSLRHRSAARTIGHQETALLQRWRGAAGKPAQQGREAKPNLMTDIGVNSKKWIGFYRSMIDTIHRTEIVPPKSRGTSEDQRSRGGLTC